MDFPELNREHRGHDFYPDRTSIPGLYETEESILGSKIIHAHFFVRGGAGDWWVAEIDHSSTTSMIGFGVADLGYEEWGNFDLVDLESLYVTRPGSQPLIVERDLHWTPKPWSEVER